MPAPGPTRMLPVAPLIEMVDGDPFRLTQLDRNARIYGEAFAATVLRSINRIRRQPLVTVDTADRICAAFRTHLSLVYPEEYWEVDLSERRKRRAA